MNSLVGFNRTTCFLSIASMVWLVVVHGIAFLAFGVTFMAACVIVGGMAATLAGILTYIAWELRQAETLPSEEPLPSTQDVNLLMLTRSSDSTRVHQHRRTRTRLCGQHPVTDRIVSFHRPPHLDRRVKKQEKEEEPVAEPFVDYLKTNGRITPSAN